METLDLRTKYQDNIEVIKRLKNMLNTSTEVSREDIKASIKMVEKEQENIVRNMRTNIYKNLTKKERLLFKEKEPILDENDNVVYEASDVKISDAKEDTHLKVINITGEEEKKNDDITEVLKKEFTLEKELEDAKIIYDGSYKLIYNNGQSIYEQKENEVLLDMSLEDKQISHNFNIINMLKNFDKENGTYINDRYMKDELPVFYAFDKLDKSKDKIVRKKAKKIAKRERKYNENVSIFDNKLKRMSKRIALAVGAGILVAGGMVESILKFNSSEVDYSSETSVVTNAGVSDASYEEIKVEAVPVIEEVPELDLDKEKTDVKENTIEEKTEVKEETVETKEEPVKIGSNYELESVDLYRSSTDEKAIGNTSRLGQDHTYETSLVAVVYNNQVVMKLTYSDSMDIEELESICKDKYGDSAQIFLNFNELDKDGNLVTKNVGWTLKDQVLSKGKVLKR